MTFLDFFCRGGSKASEHPVYVNFLYYISNGVKVCEHKVLARTNYISYGSFFVCYKPKMHAKYEVKLWRMCFLGSLNLHDYQKNRRLLFRAHSTKIVHHYVTLVAKIDNNLLT